MSQDLKDAIAFARDQAAVWQGRPHQYSPKYTLLADAAQKWLDAQPKPVWIVYAWPSASAEPWRYDASSLQEAKDMIDAALMVEGAVKFEILPPLGATTGTCPQCGNIKCRC